MPRDGEGTRNRGIIHLIDDEKDVVTIAATALEREGYQVHYFTSISELLKDVQLRCKDKISMLIADIRMPGGSGFEIARKVRAMTPDVSIIFMTAFEINSSEFNKVFPSLKVDEFLQKPFRIRALLTVVEAHLVFSPEQ